MNPEWNENRDEIFYENLMVRLLKFCLNSMSRAMYTESSPNGM